MPISMSDPIHGPIYIGSTGKDVVRIQSRLNEIFAARGETALSADGAFGRRTGQRVRMFQDMEHLQADGIVGPKTSAALGFADYVAVPPPQTRTPRGQMPTVQHSDISGDHQPVGPGPHPAPTPGGDGPFRALVNALVAALHNIRLGVVRVFNRVESIASSVANAISGIISDAIGAVQSVVRAEVHLIQVVASTLRNALRRVAARIGGLIRSVVAQIPIAAVMAMIGRAVQAVIGLVEQVVDRLIDWADAALERTGVIGMASAIVAAFVAGVDQISLL